MKSDPFSNPTRLRAGLSALLAGAFLVACSAEVSHEADSGSESGDPSATADSTDGGAEVADGSQMPDSAASAEGAGPAAGDGFQGSRDTLDTGFDLTKVAVDDPAPNRTVAQYDPIADANAPKGHISLVDGLSEGHDFGVMRQGDVGKHTFRLKSDGDAPLVITRLKPSCGCTVAEVALLGAEGERTIYRTGEQIPVGTEFEIVAELDTTGKSNAVSTSIAIYSNDPRAIFNLSLKADVKPVLMIEPEPTIQFGELSTVESSTNEVVVSSDSLDPFLLSVDEGYLQGQPVEVDLAPIDPDAEGRSQRWNVTVTVGPNFPREGINNFQIVLNTDQEIANPPNPNADGTPVVHQVRAFAQATVVAMVTAQPTFVSFGLMRPQEEVVRTTRIYTVDPEFTLPAEPVVRLEGFRGVEFQHSEHFELTVLPVEGENALDLEIKLLGMPEGFSGSFGGMAIVEVGHPSKSEVQVRISGLCRAGVQSAAGGQTPPAGGHDGHDH